MTNSTVDPDTKMIYFWVPVTSESEGALALEINLALEFIKQFRAKRDTLGDVLFSNYLFEVRIRQQKFLRVLLNNFLLNRLE